MPAIKIEGPLPKRLNSCSLIMMGGGVKGLAYMGALQVLDPYFTFDHFVGTSVGAISAILLAAGYTSDELRSLLGDQKFTDFLDASFLALPWNLFRKGGLYPGDEIQKWIDQCLAKKIKSPTEVKLGDLPNRVSLIAAIDDDTKPIIFDSEDLRWKDTSASFAVRCSMSFPLVFMPQYHEGRPVQDGGLRDNFPLDVYLTQIQNPNLSFVGFYLGPRTFEGKEKPSFLDGVLQSDLVQIVSAGTLGASEKSLGHHHNNLVIIDTRPIRTLDFQLSERDKLGLIHIGQEAAKDFLSRQDMVDIKSGNSSPIDSSNLQTTKESRSIFQFDLAKIWRNPIFQISFSIIFYGLLLLFVLWPVVRDGALVQIGQYMPHPVAGEVRKGKVDGINYVFVPPDTYRVSSRRGFFVTKEGFWISQTEITNKQYEECMDNGNCRTPPKSEFNPGWKNDNTQDHPVTGLSFEAAAEYAKWAGGHIPLPEEWEVACAGKRGRKYPWGYDDPDESKANFNKADNPNSIDLADSHHDGASPFNVYNMAGNVAEMTDAQTDPEDGKLVIIRGGTYTATGSALAYLQCAYRRGTWTGEDTNEKVGFRVIIPRWPLWWQIKN